MSNKKWLSHLRPRFSVGTLLILILLCALPLGHIAKRRAVNARRWREFQALTTKGMRFYSDDAATPLTNKSAFTRTWLQALYDVAPEFKRVSLIQFDAPASPKLTADDSDLSRLLLFSEIAQIDIERAQNITDAGLTSLASLPDVKRLNARQLPLVDGSFLQSFENTPSLESLCLTDLPALRGEHLAALGKMRKLRGIAIHSCPAVNTRSLQQVDLPGQLTHLRLGEAIFGTSPASSMDIGDEVLAKWLSQTNLRMLWLNAPITRELVPSLAAQTALESVRITNAPLVDADLEFLGKCRRLSDLTLTGLPANGCFLKAFSARPRLNFLALNSMPLAEEELTELKRFMLLQRLQLNYTPVEGRFLADLKLPEFYRLDLWGVQFCEEGKDNLVRMPGLNSVSYPSNWTALDLRRYARGAVPSNVTLCSLHRAEAKYLGAKVDSYYSPWIELDIPRVKADAIDRCPPELMAPVIQLRDRARAEGEMLKKQRPSRSDP